MDKVTDPALLEELRGLYESEKNTPSIERQFSAESVTDPVLLSELNEEASSKENWLEDPMMASRAILDGFFYGFSDEIGASISAGMVQLLQPELVEDKSYLEVRREMIKELETQQAKWADDNFGLALGLNVVGAVGSGTAAFKGLQSAGKALSSTRAVQPAVQAIQQRGLQSALQKAALTPAPATALEASIAATPTVAGGLLQASKQAAPYAPLLAAEGGLAGIGYAEQGSDLVEAGVTGAGMGVAFGLPMMTGLNYVLNGVSKNRIAQQIGQKEDFIPLSIALKERAAGTYEKTLGWMYNKVLNKAFGSDSLLESQAKQVSVRADQELAKEGVKTEQAINVAKAKLSQAKNSTVVEQKVSQLKAEAKAEDLEESFNLSDAKLKIKTDAAKESDSAINLANAAFRVNLAIDSIPVNAPKEIVEEIKNAADPQIRQRLINEAWSADSVFGMLKNRSFRINKEQISKELEVLINSELAELSPKLNGGEDVATFIASFLEKKTNRNGWISGEELSSIRSELGRIGNMYPDQGAGAAQGYQIKRLVDVLNDRIESQLSGTAFDAFKAEKQRWKTNLALRESVLQSTKKSGAFTADDYLGTLKKLFPKDAQEKRGVFQREAEELRDLNIKQDETISELSEEAIRNMERNSKKNNLSAKKDLENRIKDLEKQQKTKVYNAERTAEIETELASTNQRLAELKSFTEELDSLKKSSEDSALIKVFYTSSLASPVIGLGLGGILAAPITGAGIASGLGTQAAQRTLVGQTGWQQGLANLMGKKPVEKTISRLSGVGDSGAMGAEEGTYTQMDILMSQTDQRKIKAYQNLSKSGKLSELQRLNPKVYKSLIAAVEKRKAQ